MGRRPTYKPPQPANLTLEQMHRGSERLKRRIEDLEAFEPSKISKRFGPEAEALLTSIEDTLDKVFGHDTVERHRYAIDTLDNGPISMWSEGVDFRPYLEEGRTRAIGILQAAIRSLEEEIEEQSGTVMASRQPGGADEHGAREPSRRVFIVHGRDEGPREAVARFLERLGFEPIILHEQANRGRTVIEKVEQYANVDFAVVLLTPDDSGSLAGEPPRPRARQNVILELGFFIGRLGRSNVCTLKVGDLEIPSDWQGVVDEPFTGEWRMTLARELQAAGYEIDWNLVMQ